MDESEERANGVMVKEVPVPLVRANQLMLVLGTLAAIALRSQWLILALFLLTLTPLLLGPRMNLAFRAAKGALGSRLFYARTESIELQRFNQIIATTCLMLATVFAFAGPRWLAWVWAGFVAVAASAALLGYCIGCAVYYPYKRSLAKLRRKLPGLGPFFDFVAGTGAFIPPMQERQQPLMLMGLAHEAIRSGLLELERAASGEAQGAAEDLRRPALELMRCIDHHAAQEDRAMYPPFDEKSPGVTRPFQDEHEAGERTENAALVRLLDGPPPRSAGDAAQWRKAIARWVDFNRAHLLHEEAILSPLTLKLFTYDEARDIVRSILKVAPDEYRSFHLPYVFGRLSPGQRFSYAAVLKACCGPEEFPDYEQVLRPLVPAAAWDDFVNVARYIA